ncbi:flagellar protein FlaG [Paenibacillus sp. J5C_2022]|uniref:flagellar protein FlaG n=1 Tax=Paenibacillus sp. J5C2022 TaxID=2977129 RepID=UPI0021D32D50|nr:flagellar protein FlaG [Paenibacillus sp. J5C2022]MCU6708438.1 flagellar protein FlaG [Paenibacillus sp. J5C2022]
MNVNSSVTGAGSVDRSALAKIPVDASISQSQSSTTTISSITNLNDLKSAEMRGEQITISDEQLVKAIEQAIKAMQGKATNLEFSVHEKTKQIAVKVLDSESGEVIREIPPEKILDFVAKLWEMAGIIIDEKR